MEKHIVHCDLDTFFVSVERLLNPALAGRPVLVGSLSDRGVVASCSYEARQFGIHSAMPMRLARQLCPEAIVVRGDHDQYTKYSRLVTEVIEMYTPVVEKASIDEHYLDLTGMDKFFGCWKWAQELRQKIMKETQLPITFGLSANKTVSKVATGEAKPCNVRKVDNGTEKEFLAPLSIRKIPMVGDKTYTRLRNMGISHIRTLQEMEAETLRKVLGENGVNIWRKANGIDDTPVSPYREQKSMSKETTFEKDTIDMKKLHTVISKMTDELSFDLRQDNKLTGCITLKIRYADFETVTRQERINYSCSEKILSAKAFELFNKLYSKRMLIRLIGIKFSELISGSHQIDLFNDVEKDLSIMQAMDSIRSKYGKETVMRGSCFLSDKV